MIMIRPGGFYPRERLCVRPAAVVESLDSPGPCVARRERERERERERNPHSPPTSAVLPPTLFIGHFRREM
jgi:hypothetical protein